GCRDVPGRKRVAARLAAGARTPGRARRGARLAPRCRTPPGRARAPVMNGAHASLLPAAPMRCDAAPTGTSSPLVSRHRLDDVLARGPEGTVRVRDFIADAEAFAERLPPE